MNTQERRNISRKQLDPAFNNKEGVIKISKANSLEHELAKFFLCWEALNADQQFITEARFKNGKRADIFILDTCEAWEVLHTETEEQVKSKDYPVSIVRAFKAKKINDFYVKIK
jgi:hypothetical protein